MFLSTSKSTLQPEEPEWSNLFVQDFPGYEDIVSRNITVLTGTRGCGKTMVFRRLSALLGFKVGPLTREADSFIGFYLSMNDIADAFLFDHRPSVNDAYSRRVIQFFHLSLLCEIVQVAAAARQNAPDQMFGITTVRFSSCEFLGTP